MCLTNNFCNKNFFNFKNFCCKGECCNMFFYVTSSADYWDNFMETLIDLRPINFIIYTFIFCLLICLIGTLCQFFCCLDSDNISTKKYKNVTQNSNFV